jgi:hypothetical protein
VADAINPPNLAFTIGLVGVVVAFRRRRWDLTALLVVSVFGVAVVDRWMAIPLAVLAGLAVDSALEEPRRLGSAALFAVGAVTALTGVLLADSRATLTAEERELMAWAEQETAPNATFAVIGYPVDRGFVEWFPALSERENVTTWQGSEWHPAGDRRERATEMGECRAAICLPQVDYYVVRGACCPGVTNELVEVRAGVFRSD